MSEAVGCSDLALLRAHEPVLRFTAGEYFVPVAVDAVVAQSRLMLRVGDEISVVAPAGRLDLDQLAEHGSRHTGPGLSLSGISSSTKFGDVLRSWLPRPRPRFRAGSRLAQVGLLGRSIDTLSRVSLLVRGAVPGGSAAESLAKQEQHFHPERPTYYGRVVRDEHWIVCQYWFYYAFNNWRSGFSGVNEHEGDWEQVTVYLDGSGLLGPDGLPQPRWVVFSAHDETGDDLRRRWDDPDLTVHAERHPVVFVGAGSHSGAYLAGDYLITIVPPSWGGTIPTLRRLARLFTPWIRAAQGSGLGIPYIDYARGDGASVGPGHDTAWHPVVIDDETPWVRDYRGLWGHDTRDAFGGERGPAGPRYDRDTTVRLPWGDPVGWAGLSKVAPNPAVELMLVEARIDEIDRELGRLDDETATGRTALTTRAAGLDPSSLSVHDLGGDERRLSQTRMEAVRLRDERSRMDRARREGLEVADPHAHLGSRRTPITASERGRARLLSVWAVISTPLVLCFAAGLFRPDLFARPVAFAFLLALVLSVEAFVRGYFFSFVFRLAVITAVVVVFVLFVENWQVVTFWVLLVSAVLVLVVNVRDALRR